MPNYELGKIYKIVNDNIPGKVYYGSTSQKYLSTRFSRHKHKNNKCTSRELFIVEGARIELVETFPCNSVYELKNRERYYIENYECVNKKVPNRTQSELERNPEQKEKKKKKREKKNYVCIPYLARDNPADTRCRGLLLQFPKQEQASASCR